MSLSRRNFIKNTMLFAGGIYLPIDALLAKQKSEHFFITFVVNGGLDTSYTFDARDRSLTKSGILANYMPEDLQPFLWEGKNGESTLANYYMKNLEPYKENFSILNGVLMATGFDGHPQNINHLFTGGAFGGESFIPHLFKRQSSLIDYLQMGEIYADITNAGSSLNLNSKKDIISLGEIYKSAPFLKKTQLNQFLHSRYQTNHKGDGLFSKGVMSLEKASLVAPKVIKRLKKVATPNIEDKLLLKLETAYQYFSQGITNSCVIEIGFDNLFADTHDSTSAKATPKLIEKYTQEVAKIMKFLNNKKIKTDSTMMDHTTFMITSEFGRTMRQKNLKIDQTGTDHNPLTNTVLIGGKGIKPGLVIGQSDRTTVEEKLSSAHQKLDQEDLKIMGRPFNFKTMRTHTNLLPEIFHIEDYLTIDAVVNTLYELMEVDQSHYRSYDREGTKKVPTLSKLLNT